MDKDIHRDVFDVHCLRPGRIVRIPAGEVRRIENAGACDQCSLCIVTPPRREEDAGPVC